MAMSCGGAIVVLQYSSVMQRIRSHVLKISRLGRTSRKLEKRTDTGSYTPSTTVHTISASSPIVRLLEHIGEP
jgi:hypothetical protein